MNIGLLVDPVPASALNMLIYDHELQYINNNHKEARKYKRNHTKISTVSDEKLPKVKVKYNYTNNNAYKRLLAEARNRATTPERLFEIRQEIKQLKRDLQKEAARVIFSWKV